uniref:Putative Thiamine pyrophosphate enzyme, C-terminal TPP-binding domain protein n=1 Tax=uncultured marine microorganism HF4000_ANIW141K23 TaxID=455538 RepID=B3T5P2_9ZZZZ|nr:putative Thiamine pyrophosphate enzyme, C-terminal TPP-binding domain protein [uncultured marine microorganism HF4000_ANIW141K23]
MIRKAAISTVVKKIGNHPIISANGFISRDLFEVCDKSSNFYMIGSMGLASSIGLGVALKNPRKSVFIFDGDGNILMNLGSLTTIASQKPKNLIHVVFDNSVHESTGGQPTNSNFVNIEKIAKACNYNHTFTVRTENNLLKILDKIKKLKGPIMIVVKIQQSKGEKSKRVNILSVDIKERFMLS